MNNAQDSRNFLIIMTWQLSNASFNIQHQQTVWILDNTYGKLHNLMQESLQCQQQLCQKIIK